MKATNVPPQGFIYLIITIVVLIVVYQSMKRLGLVQTWYTRRHDKKQEELKHEQEVKEITAVSDINKAPFFKPTYYKSFPSNVLLSEKEALDYANKLGHAMGKWWWQPDDEAAIYNVFRSLDNKVQVSQVAEAYSNMWNVDLVGYLIERLDSSEISIIMDIVNELPDR